MFEEFSAITRGKRQSGANQEEVREVTAMKEDVMGDCRVLAINYGMAQCLVCKTSWENLKILIATVKPRGNIGLNVGW